MTGPPKWVLDTRHRMPVCLSVCLSVCLWTTTSRGEVSTDAQKAGPKPRLLSLLLSSVRLDDQAQAWVKMSWLGEAKTPVEMCIALFAPLAEVRKSAKKPPVVATPVSPTMHRLST